MKYITFSIIFLVLISACVQEEEPLTQVRISGHSHIYQFEHDIRDALKFPVNNIVAVNEMLWNTNKLNVVFNGSSKEDNRYFSVVMVNLGKLQTFFAYEGKAFNFNTFPVYYYTDSKWYNGRTNEAIPRPSLEEATLWLLGPNTGARGNGIILLNNTIYLHGTSYKNLTLAADKLVLTVMGISRMEDIPGYED